MLKDEPIWNSSFANWLSECITSSVSIYNIINRKQGEQIHQHLDVFLEEQFAWQNKIKPPDSEWPVPFQWAQSWACSTQMSVIVIIASKPFRCSSFKQGIRFLVYIYIWHSPVPGNVFVDIFLFSGSVWWLSIFMEMEFLQNSKSLFLFIQCLSTSENSSFRF